MSDTKIGICELDLHLPGVASLKEKRGIIKSMLNKMRKQFNVSTAEVAYQDVWQSSKIAITTVSPSSQVIHKRMQTIIKWIEAHYPDAHIMDEDIEIIS